MIDTVRQGVCPLPSAGFAAIMNPLENAEFAFYNHALAEKSR
jgi:hypothetical protein